MLRGIYSINVVQRSIQAQQKTSCHGVCGRNPPTRLDQFLLNFLRTFGRRRIGCEVHFMQIGD